MELEEISAAAAETPPVTPKTPESLEKEALKSDESANIEEPQPDPEEIIKPLKKKKTAEERISELTWKRREAEREVEFWKTKATAQSNDTNSNAISGTASLRPKLDNFETTESYEDALLAWHLAGNSAKQEEDRRKEKESQRLTEFNRKAEKLRGTYEDFDETVNAPVFTGVMRDVLLSSENGPVMAYYLGRPENIQAAERIAALPPELQSYEIGRLETKLLLAQKTKKISNAPTPISPLSGTGSDSSPIDESKLSGDEWYALEKKRKFEKLKKSRGG